MAIDTVPLVLAAERICVINGRPEEAKIIDFGSELKCQEVLANLTSRKLSKLDHDTDECENVNFLIVFIKNLSALSIEKKFKASSRKLSIWRQNSNLL